MSSQHLLVIGPVNLLRSTRGLNDSPARVKLVIRASIDPFLLILMAINFISHYFIRI